MKPKTIKILYWIVTIIFCLANLFSGLADFFPNQMAIDVMKQLGYPLYLLTILGLAKVLGSIAILQTKFKTIKEWAFAGFTIDYISASASFYFIKGGVFAMLFPMIFLVVMFVDYWLWKKYGQMKG